jgi:pimeloyl-ACP methyl ester carboxylesterase
MAAIPLVLRTEPYYKAFREKHLRSGSAHPPVMAERFVWVKADVRSHHAHLLRQEDRSEVDNVSFVCPLVLPRRPGPFRQIIIILHGLNESEYRKYFPWACTLASADIPVLLFPLAFLVNRRPRRWRDDAAAQDRLRSRQTLSGNEVATRYNVVLSERLQEHPERLFLGGQQSYFDLLDVIERLRQGVFTIDNRDAEMLIPQRPFAEATQVDLLGFSIGGYLTLGLLLEEQQNTVLLDSRGIIFAAAAPWTHADATVNANPFSPFILDRLATKRLQAFYRSVEADALLDNAQGRWCRAMFRAERDVLEAPLARIRGRLLTIGNTADTVIPTAGMVATFGDLDCLLHLGAHEYPFSVADVWQAGVNRGIAKSYNVHPAYEAGFQQFMEVMVEFLQRRG